MPKHKVLKSVARSAADSFISLMNWGEGDYVMGNLLVAARDTGRDTLEGDLLTGQGHPPELMTRPIQASLVSRAGWLPKLIASSGADMSFVTSARLTVKFDTSITRPLLRDPSVLESPYVCMVRIVDDRGKSYDAVLSGWWYPERIPPKQPGFIARIRKLLARD